MGAESFVGSGGVKRPNDPTALMLNVGNPKFAEYFMQIYARVRELYKQEHVSAKDEEFFRSFLQKELKPFNFREYGNPVHEGIHYRVSMSDMMAAMKVMAG